MLGKKISFKICMLFVKGEPISTQKTWEENFVLSIHLINATGENWLRVVRGSDFSSVKSWDKWLFLKDVTQDPHL